MACELAKNTLEDEWIQAIRVLRYLRIDDAAIIEILDLSRQTGLDELDLGEATSGGLRARLRDILDIWQSGVTFFADPGLLERWLKQTYPPFADTPLARMKDRSGGLRFVRLRLDEMSVTGDSGL